MAPAKKSKKAAEGINSRLALVMKSGKGMSSVPYGVQDLIVRNRCTD